MKKVILNVAGIVALATVGMASASNDNMAVADQPLSSPSGIYVEGNMGYGVVQVFSNPLQGIGNFTNSGFTWNGNLGYQFNPYFALESGYTQFANVKAWQNRFVETLYNYGVDLLVKGIYPVNNQFSVFAKVGAMYLHTKQTTTNTPGYTTFFYAPNGGTATDERYLAEFGLGTSYYVTSHLYTTLQGIATVEGIYAGYLGLGYKFDV